MKKMIIAGLMALCTAMPALADETWTSKFGEVVWVTDVDGTAIFSVPTEIGGEAQIYLPGFNMNIKRDTHWGYWLIPGGESCDADLTGINGIASNQWGRVVVIFDKPDYPTSFTAAFGKCHGPLDKGLRAEFDPN